MSGGQMMVVLIVAIVMVASIIRAKYGYSRRRSGDAAIPAEERAATLRLRDEVKELKERIKVLERITVEKENSLAKQIDELRDR
ncbi:MAG: hypothetical protein ACR2JJ_03440 [Sphingomicrobium sp.]